MWNKEVKEPAVEESQQLVELILQLLQEKKDLLDMSVSAIFKYVTLFHLQRKATSDTWYKMKPSTFFCFS